MKRKAKRPAQSPNTMPPERLAPILDYLRQHAQTWDDAREAVAIRICHAFAETTLGNGIGILEADCIDDYLNETAPEYRRCRAQDEREHWENVLFQGHLENSLPRFNPFSAISFMDGAGRRFALPYYLLWALQNPDCSAHEILSYALANDFHTNNLPLNPAQQRALYAAIAHLAESEAEDYYTYRSSPWDKALAHLTQALPDLEAA